MTRGQLRQRRERIRVALQVIAFVVALPCVAALGWAIGEGSFQQIHAASQLHH